MKMKINLEFVKLLIRLLILLVLLTMLFIISLFLYSARYWPDVYNYIRANVTINSIQKISDLNITVYEDFTTEGYSTTNLDYTDMTTDEGFDLDIQDFLDDKIESPKAKREVNIDDATDIVRFPGNTVIVDYFFDVEVKNPKILKDLLDESELKMKKSDDVEMLNARHYFGFKEYEASYFCSTKGLTISDAVFPSIATIFVKNDSNDQFDYYCDGTLISENIVLTSARCVTSSNGTRSSQDYLVILGKRSLQDMTGKEAITKISNLITHEAFTPSPAQHDLALLVLEAVVPSSPAVHPACLWPDEGQEAISATTGWAVNSRLAAIFFTEASKPCTRHKAENTFCATYANEIATCPSYGGAYASKRDDIWYVSGIQYGDPTYRGICFNRTIEYTDLNKYKQWITNVVEQNKK